MPALLANEWNPIFPILPLLLTCFLALRLSLGETACSSGFCVRGVGRRANARRLCPGGARALRDRVGCVGVGYGPGFETRSRTSAGAPGS